MAIPTAPTPSRRTRAQSRSSSQSNPPSFRIGRVRAYLRGEVWYLCYWENGHRRQPRVSRDHDVARQQAAEINAQLESGAPSNYGFDPISFTDLQRRWLDHHEYVRRTSLQTIRRYRAATNHLLRFTSDIQPVRRVSDFRTLQAEAFVRYLREVRVAPQPHELSHVSLSQRVPPLAWLAGDHNSYTLGVVTFVCTSQAQWSRDLRLHRRRSAGRIRHVVVGRVLDRLNPALLRLARRRRHPTHASRS